MALLTRHAEERIALPVDCKIISVLGGTLLNFGPLDNRNSGSRLTGYGQALIIALEVSCRIIYTTERVWETAYSCTKLPVLAYNPYLSPPSFLKNTRRFIEAF